MANEVLSSLLKEYEQKKLQAEIDLEKRKSSLYLLIPRLKIIEDELNTYAINTTKSILQSSESSEYTIENLKIKISNLKRERELILLQNNLTLDYLKPFYECKICKDTGFVTTPDYKTTMCSCLKQKLLDISFNKSNIYNLKKENFSSFNDNYFSEEVDLSKYKFNISPRKNILNIKNKSLEFIENFENPEYKNLLFVGSTGLR